MFTVSFFGHRKIDNHSALEKSIEQFIYDILEKESYVQFLVGRNGEFDRMVASCYKRVVHRYSFENSFLVLVLPYNTAELKNNSKSLEEYFDAVEICEKSHGAFYKDAFRIRNRDMVDRSDLTVFYVNSDFGGAYNTLCYAKQINKSVLNFADTIKAVY